MKRIFSFLLVFILLLPLWGCQQEDTTFVPRFFYPLQNYGYNELEGRFNTNSISDELREDIIYRSSAQVIEAYLNGPLDPALQNPFPADTKLVDLHVEGTKLHLILTDHLSELTGIPLIMACACLAQTAMTLTNMQEVQIRCETAQLDGEMSITINSSSMVFNDQIIDKNAQ